MHVTLDHITKKFDDFTAVQDFSARLEDHEIETNHVPSEVDLTNAISINLFFHSFL